MNRAANGVAGLDALLRYLGGVRDREIDRLRQQAEHDANALRVGAREKAAAQVRRALDEARRDVDGRIAHARAQSQGRLRRLRHELTAMALDGVWTRIGQALAARWRDPAPRRAWVERSLEQAAGHLPAGTWRVVHPETWNPSECTSACEALRVRRPDVQLTFEAAAIEAGIRIHAGPAHFDATASGLLRDRARVEGLWLREFGNSRTDR